MLFGRKSNGTGHCQCYYYACRPILYFYGYIFLILYNFLVGKKSSWNLRWVLSRFPHFSFNLIIMVPKYEHLNIHYMDQGALWWWWCYFNSAAMSWRVSDGRSWWACRQEGLDNHGLWWMKLIDLVVFATDAKDTRAQWMVCTFDKIAHP